MKFNNLYKAFLAVCIVGSQFIANAADTLTPGSSLSHGQYIQSNSGKYRLILQSDGNLVYYRTSDNFPRWNTMTNSGTNAPMQGDGNFVLYDAAGRPIWNAGTFGNPGASVSAQDDGNLVIYSNGRALWNIGPEPKYDDPKMPGDVLLRDMERNIPFLSELLGHNGLFDGAHVFEVEPGGDANAVKYNTLASFKTRAQYRGAASPDIPYFLLNGCWDPSFCGRSSYENISARVAIVKRARQIYGIGADYTYTAQYTRANPKSYGLPGGPNIPGRRGMYRCDTFILDTYKLSGNYLDQNGNAGTHLDYVPAAMKKWIIFVDQKLGDGVVPTLIFNRLKEYMP